MEKHNTLDDVATSARVTTGGAASSKLKRAFSMPRNPFQGSRGSNQPAKAVGNGNGTAATTAAGAKDDESRCDSRLTNSNQKKSTTTTVSNGVGADGAGGNGNGSEKKIFRRLSVKKFINRIAQQMTYVNRTVGNHKFDKVQSSQPSSLNGTARSGVAGGGGASGNFVWPPDTVPGVIGLRNHGNTCFMNAVLQCLSHTDILAQYFVLDLYKADLKRRNKINAKKFGTKGELTEQLALVLKSLWTCKDAPDYSSNFKAVVDRYGSQFRSSTQHDAQEFLFWLLDKVHEDLNTATKRKYKAIKNNGRSDEVIAAETLANYVRCNNSFVQAVFQAQFRSSLSCPTCGKQSNTFDPFYCLSVPLPQLSQQPVLVKVIYSSQQPKQVKLGLGIPHGSPVLALREQLHADTGIALDRMILTEICESGFSRVFCDSHLMSSVRENDPLYCIECPPAGSGQEAASGTKIVLCLCNGKRDFAGHVKRFGTPFCLVVNRDVSYSELQKLLLKEMSNILRSEVFTFATPAQNLFRMRLQDPSCDADTYLETTVEHPLFTEMIDLALSVLPTDAGPAHVKLLLEWTEPERFFNDMGDPFVEHESVSQMREKIPASSALTLEQCFEHYTKAETLGQDNAWKCPHCQEYLPVVKTLGLWSLPDIMVIHLKRFRQQQLRASTQAAKLTNLVKFPLHSFDMTPHLARDPSAHQQPSQPSQILNNNSSAQSQQHHTLDRSHGTGYTDTDNWSPWRKIMRSAHSTQTHSMLAGVGGGGGTGRRQLAMDNRYDLYAVCYHQGDTLETGHYTAACKNPYDGQWYRFDDQRVSHVPNDRIDEEIINNEAYLLFYQRRKLPTDGSGDCSGSSSSSSGDHWVSKIIVPPAPTSAASSSTLERNKVQPVTTATKSLTATVPTTETATTTPTTSSAASEIATETMASNSLDSATAKSSDTLIKANNKVEVMSVSSTNEKCGVEKVGTEEEHVCVSEVTDVAEIPKGDAVGDVTAIKSDQQSSLPSLSSSAVVPTEKQEIIIATPDAKESKNGIDEATNQSSETPNVNKSECSQAASTVSKVATDQTPPKETLNRRFNQTSKSVENGTQESTKQQPPLRTNKHDRLEQKLGLATASSATNGGGRFSLPSSQQFQDILWRENMSELMHHRPSSFTTYKSVMDAGDAVSLIRGANTCSKDTLLFIDQQNHGLVDRVVLDDDDDPDDLLPPGSGSRALWVCIRPKIGTRFRMNPIQKHLEGAICKSIGTKKVTKVCMEKHEETKQLKRWKIVSSPYHWKETNSTATSLQDHVCSKQQSAPAAPPPNGAAVQQPHIPYNIDWIFPRLRRPNRLWHIASTGVIGLVGFFSKIIIVWLNKARVHNIDVLENALEHRPKGKSLLTVSNHHSCFDDPGIWGLLKLRNVCNKNVIRWSMAAHDICFTCKAHSLFFMYGKCIPVVRGGGVYQPAVDLCIEKLKLGDWVHVFPEGKVNMTKEDLRFKWGVGRIIYETPDPPIIIPIWHIGMDDVLPNEPPYYIRMGKKLTYNFGNPIDLSALMERLRSSPVSEEEARKQITDRIQEEMMLLKQQTERLHSDYVKS
uniref:Tafazzin n=1 Tax=Anopheles christyi TaxID=43041 RepID=A0A182JW52_9DIPT